MVVVCSPTTIFLIPYISIAISFSPISVLCMIPSRIRILFRYNYSSKRIDCYLLRFRLRKERKNNHQA